MTVEPLGTVGGIGIASGTVPAVTGGATGDVPLVESPPSVVNVNAVTPTLSVTWARNSAISPAATRVEPLAVVNAVTVGLTVSAMCNTRPIVVVLPDVSLATIDSVGVCGACNSPGRTTREGVPRALRAGSDGLGSAARQRRIADNRHAGQRDIVSRVGNDVDAGTRQHERIVDGGQNRQRGPDRILNRQRHRCGGASATEAVGRRRPER